MQIKNPFLDDLAKTLTGAMGGVSHVKQDLDALIQSHIEKALHTCDVPSQEDHLVLKKLVTKLRAENTDLKNRVDALEKALHHD